MWQDKQPGASLLNLSDTIKHTSGTHKVVRMPAGLLSVAMTAGRAGETPRLNRGCWIAGPCQVRTERRADPKAHYRLQVTLCTCGRVYASALPVGSWLHAGVAQAENSLVFAIGLGSSLPIPHFTIRCYSIKRINKSKRVN